MRERARPLQDVRRDFSVCPGRSCAALQPRPERRNWRDRDRKPSSDRGSAGDRARRRLLGNRQATPRDQVSRRERDLLQQVRIPERDHHDLRATISGAIPRPVSSTDTASRNRAMPVSW